MNARRRRQSGIALLMVLWVLVLFSTVAVSYAFGLRAEARMTRNQLERATAEALAEAGVARALQVLSAADGLAERYGRVERIALGAGRVEWTVQNAAGLFNLNTASINQLRALFGRFGVAAPRAEELADAIADWRDVDELRHAAGAEDRDYRMQGLAHGAADAPFSHRAELLQVLGMDPALYAVLAPHVTVHGQHSGVNPRFASRALLLILGAGSAQEIDEYLQRRRLAPTLAQPPLSVELAGSGLLGSASSAYAVVQARGQTPGGARVTVQVLTDLGTARDGLELVDWQYLEAAVGGGDVE